MLDTNEAAPLAREQTNENAKNYRTLLISRVQTVLWNGHHYGDPLWCLDINANARELDGLQLLAPVTRVEGNDPAQIEKLERLDERIVVTDAGSISIERLDALIEQVDVVELPGNFDWSRAKVARKALKAARRHGRLVILGISSNRVKTTMMNARGKSWPRRFKARLRAENIRQTQRYLARNVDAVRVVGHGVAQLIEDQAEIVQVEVASWIRAEDIRPPNPELHGMGKVMIASRLEPMKGVNVGVEAVALAQEPDKRIALSIVGVGAEEAALRERVAQLGIERETVFTGQLGYPEPFYDAVAQHDFVLLTNLNDEQPRLIFDAISRGAIPICPRNAAYNDLGLDERIFYTQGDPKSLAQTLRRLIDAPVAVRMDIQMALSKVARARTIESMHAGRADWIRGLLGLQEPQGEFAIAAE